MEKSYDSEDKFYEDETPNLTESSVVTKSYRQKHLIQIF